MKGKILFLMVLVANVAFAQQNKKLEKLYKKKQFEKLQSKTEHYYRKNKITESELATYRLLANLNLQPNWSDTIQINLLATDLAIVKNEKPKSKIQNIAIAQLKAGLVKSTSKFYREKDSLMMGYVAKKLIEFYADSVIYNRYYKPKKTVVKTTESHIISLKPNRDSIIAYANRHLGIPYYWAGINPKQGFDCSGFTRFLYQKVGIELIHFAKEQAKIGIETDWRSAKMGDLIFFGKKYDNGKLKIDHVGVFYSVSENGNPIIIHCSSNGTCYQELKPGEYWSKKLLFCRNVIDNYSSNLLTTN